MPGTGESGSLPVQLRVQGRRCLVVGGGLVAARRCRTLVDAGARVDVVAPELVDPLEQLALEGRIEHHRRVVRDADLVRDDHDPLVLVVVATDDPAVNAHVGRVAAANGVLVNRADDGAAGDLAFPATVRRGPVTIVVGTSGASPVATRWVADTLDERLDEVLGLDAAGLALLVEVLAEVRRERAALRHGAGALAASQERGAEVELVDWRSALDGSILDLIHQGRRAEAKERLLACLSS